MSTQYDQVLTVEFVGNAITTSGTPIDPLAIFCRGRRTELAPDPYKLLWYMYGQYTECGRTFFDYRELGTAIWGDAAKAPSCIGATAKEIRKKLNHLEAQVEIRVCTDGLELRSKITPRKCEKE